MGGISADPNLANVHAALAQIEHERCILFGSRARGEARRGSDYDLLVVVADGVSDGECLARAAVVRSFLARRLLDADVVVVRAGEVEARRQLPGSIERHALREGIAL